MDLERERGITIKSHAIQMEYIYKRREVHVESDRYAGTCGFLIRGFAFHRGLRGALLIVDATQGVQAQTISNLYMAIEHDLEIIPVINKCDMVNAMPEEVEDEIIDLLGCKREEIIRASGRTGMGVDEILQAVVERIPHPEGDEDAPFAGIDIRFRVQLVPWDYRLFQNRERQYQVGRRSGFYQYGQGIHG